MLLNILVTQSTYCVILCLPCAILKSFLRREKTFAQKKLYVILKIIPSEIYIRNLVEFCIMAHGEKKEVLFTDIFLYYTYYTLYFIYLLYIILYFLIGVTLKLSKNVPIDLNK